MFRSGCYLAAISLVLSSLSLSTAQAMEGIEDVDELLGLDIMGLMDVEVTVASKKSEKLSEAPGIITVISREDIKRYGGNTVYDLLQRLPNVNIYGGPFSLGGIVGVRAQTVSSDFSNNHTLTLLNGRPMRESFSGALDKAIYDGLSVESIERIEIIRGPGSVLYGSNAFAGAVNIVTRSPKEKETSFAVGYGGYKTRKASGIYADQFLDGELSLFSSAAYIKKDGFNFRAIDATGLDDEIDYFRFSNSIFAQAQYKNLQVTGFKGHLRDQIMNIVPFWFVGDPDGETHLDTRNFVDVQYTHDFNDTWKAVLNLTYNGFRGILEPNGPVDVNMNDMVYELALHGQLFDRVNFISGAIYEDHRGSVSTAPDPDFKDEWYSGYFQADYKPIEDLKLIAAVQVNKPKQSDVDYSPRFGVIYQFTPKWGAKVLYGQAFRSPYAVELKQGSFDALTGNPDLEPENITTWDYQVFYNTDKYHAALTYYRSHQSDTIGTELRPDSTPFSVNGASIDYEGIELEGKFKFTKAFEAQGSVTYQKNETVEGLNDIRHAPNLMIRTGASYASTKLGMTFSAYNTYTDKPGNMRLHFPSIVTVNEEPDAYNWLTANLEVDVNRYLKSKHLPNTTFTIYGENLFDEDVHYPEVISKSLINSLPLRGGRAIYGTVSMIF